MKILLVCAGGFSTSILMKKVRKWAEANGQDVTIDAMGKEAYENVWQNYDCILIGPQISYTLDNIKESVSIPVAAINSMDYAVGNVDNIMKIAHTITGK